MAIKGNFELLPRVLFVQFGFVSEDFLMKKLIAALFAGASGIYLATIGILPDPIPFIDEGLAFIVLMNSLAVLGFDLRRFVGMKGGKKKGTDKPIDID